MGLNQIAILDFCISTPASVHNCSWASAVSLKRVWLWHQRKELHVAGSWEPPQVQLPCLHAAAAVGEVAALREAALEKLLKVTGLCCRRRNPVFTASVWGRRRALHASTTALTGSLKAVFKANAARNLPLEAWFVCKQTNKQTSKATARDFSGHFLAVLPNDLQSRCLLICVWLFWECQWRDGAGAINPLPLPAAAAAAPPLPETSGVYFGTSAFSPRPDCPRRDRLPPGAVVVTDTI